MDTAKETFQVEGGELIKAVDGVISSFGEEKQEIMWKERVANARWKEVGGAKPKTTTKV